MTMSRQKSTNPSTEMAPDVLLTSRKSTTKIRKTRKREKGKEEYNQQQTHIIYELLNPQGYLRLRISLFDSV
jgi:hypothetical protein